MTDEARALSTIVFGFHRPVFATTKLGSCISIRKFPSGTVSSDRMGSLSYYSLVLLRVPGQCPGVQRVMRGPILGDVLLLSPDRKQTGLAVAEWNTVLREMYKVNGRSSRHYSKEDCYRVYPPRMSTPGD